MMTFASSNKFAYLDEISDDLDEALAHTKALSFSRVWYRRHKYKSFTQLSDDEHKHIKGKLIASNLALVGFNITVEDLTNTKLTGLLGYYKVKWLSLQFDSRKHYDDHYDRAMEFASSLIPLGVTVVCPYYWWLLNHSKQFRSYKLEAMYILNNINISIRKSLPMKSVAIIDTVDVLPGHGTQWLGDGKLDFAGCISDIGDGVLVGCAHSMVVRQGKTKVDNMHVVLSRLERYYD